MAARRAAAVVAWAMSDARVANHSTSFSLMPSQGGLPITASKPPSGRPLCQSRHTPGKAASQCRNSCCLAMARAFFQRVRSVAKRSGSASTPPRRNESGPSARIRYASVGLWLSASASGVSYKERFVFHAGGHPLQPAQAVKQTSQVGRGRLHVVEHRRRLVHLHHVGIGHLLDSLHPLGPRPPLRPSPIRQTSSQPVQLPDRIPARGCQPANRRT